MAKDKTHNHNTGLCKSPVMFLFCKLQTSTVT